MITIRRADERGRTRLSWLDSRHSFSFAHYTDPAHMGFSSLRVLNEDRIAPGTGFGPHPHRDMEILTYPVAGELRHRDSLGADLVLAPGRIQLMTAGTGIVHSEMNASAAEELHLLQIWLLPSERGSRPRHRQLDFDVGETATTRLVSPDGAGGTLEIGQDVSIDRVTARAGTQLERVIDSHRSLWLQVIRGDALAAGHTIGAGDGLSLHGAQALKLEVESDFEALAFDLA